MEKYNVNIVYLDFSKSFDMLSHYCLLKIMKNFVFSKKKKQYIIERYFLTDKTLKVKTGYNYVETKHISPSVPLESVLRPLLFLIFFNNLPDDIKSEVELFATDV